MAGSCATSISGGVWAGWEEEEEEDGGTAGEDWEGLEEGGGREWWGLLLVPTERAGADDAGTPTGTLKGKPGWWWLWDEEEKEEEEEEGEEEASEAATGTPWWWWWWWCWLGWGEPGAAVPSDSAAAAEGRKLASLGNPYSEFTGSGGGM